MQLTPEAFQPITAPLLMHNDEAAQAFLEGMRAHNVSQTISAFG